MTTPELTAMEYAAVELRRERDRLLAESDWVVTRSVETGNPVPAAWVAYRQALRDFPSTVQLTLNRFDHLDWRNIVFPTKPESV